jgi:hypothetical protein
MTTPHRALRAAAVTVLALLAGAAPASATVAHQSSAGVQSARTFRAPGATTHLAVHWRGRPTAHVRIALSRGRGFGRPRPVVLDDAGAAHRTRETYGAVMVAHGVRAVRVYTDRALPRLTVLWLDDRGRPAPDARSATAAQPAVLRRADWGANESLRYDSTGKETWPSAYYPVQKLIVHHTDTQNNDPDPAATIRSIYYYHAITQGWGDIGYNFLIDQQGRVYEGRHTVDYAAGTSPTEENASGYGVTAAHAQGYNSGTVGIALLGTLSSQDATPAARRSLESLLAWEAERHAIDPNGASLYTNPVSGTQATFANIAGHRDVNATECPGGTFYATLPTIRSDVAALLAPSPSFTLSASPTTRTVVRGSGTSYTISVAPTGGFSDPVTLSVSGLPSGATGSFSPAQTTTTSQLSVTTSRTSPTGTFTLHIAGTSGGLSRSTDVTLQLKRK